MYRSILMSIIVSAGLANLAFAAKTQGTSSAANRVSACAAAKQEAANQCPGGQAESFGDCSCQPATEGPDGWQCTVEATCRDDGISLLEKIKPTTVVPTTAVLGAR